MPEIIFASIVSFVGTNIDDLFIDTLFFAEVDGKAKTDVNPSARAQIRSIVVGKYLGIGTLVLISLLGAFGLQLLPQKYIGFLGLVPIALGVKAWLGYLRERRTAEGAETKRIEVDGDKMEHQEGGSNCDFRGAGGRRQNSTGLLWSVTLLTIANGADNIGVYIPMFAGFTPRQMGVVVCVFAVMIPLWCFIAKRLADLPVLKSFLLRHKGVIVPVVFVVLGLYIMIENYLF